MANIQRIRGFIAAKSLIGGDTGNPLMREYNKDAASTALFIGDPVTLEADGNITAATTGNTILGIVGAVGTETTTFGEAGYWDPNDLGKRFLAATDVGIVGVIPAEMYLFEVVDIEDNNLVQGSFAALVPGAGGSTITGNSSYTIDGSTPANDDVQVVEQVTRPDNDPLLADAAFLVKFQLTQNALD